MKTKPPRTVSPLQAHIGFWMRLVSNHVSHAFARRLEDSGVTVAEWVVLREMRLRQDVTSPSIVAEFTGLSRGAISKLVTRLLDKGLVSRRKSTDDRRYQDIELTAKGRRLIPELAAHADRNDHAFFSVLNRSEQKTLTELLQRLASHHELTTLPTE